MLAEIASFLSFLCVISLFVSSCTSGQSIVITDTSASAQGQLTPYLTPLPEITPSPFPTTTSLPSPAPSATPQTHMVAQGEDMFGIALRYGVTLAALRAANPGVDPGMLTIGSLLVIPSLDSTPDPVVGLPTPVPLTLMLDNFHCSIDSNGGAWCFLTVHNPLETGVESVSIRVDLYDTAGNVVVSHTASAPLNLIPPGDTMPLAVYFYSPLPLPFRPGVQLLIALPVSPDDLRYLPVHIENLQQELHSDSLSVDVSADLYLDVETGASEVWVLVTAYDRSDHIVGLRRWQSSAPLVSGVRQPFTLRVYSNEGAIDRVEVNAEAHQ